MNLTAKSSAGEITPLRRVALAIPNLLSFARLGLGLWFPWAPTDWRIGVVIAGGLTDLLDGTLSRALRATTVTGRILDPIADKLFVLSVLGTLLFQGEVATWQAGFVAFRDLAVLIGVIGVVLRSGMAAVKEMPPSLLGKSATAAQFAFFVCVLFFPNAFTVAFVIAAVVSVLAGADYLRRYVKGGAAAAMLFACCPGILTVAIAAERAFAAAHGLGPQQADTSKAQPSPEARAIAFLAREVPGWPTENRCFSCHNNGDGARALFVVLRFKQRVPPDALKSTTSWLATPDAWDAAAGDAVFKDKRLARIQFAAALAAAVRAELIRDSTALRRAAELVASDQQPDGAWHVEPPGSVGSPATYGRPLATAIAVTTLQAADAERFHKEIAAGRRWISRLPVQNVLEAAAVLFDVRDLSDLESRAEVRRSFEFLARAQTSDGGWGPFASASPENFDTAVAIIALAPFKERPDARASIARGRAYLLAQQQTDGGWPETTRPPGAASYAQRLSTTAWATLAIVGTSDVTDRQNE